VEPNSETGKYNAGFFISKGMIMFSNLQQSGKADKCKLLELDSDQSALHNNWISYQIHLFQKKFSAIILNFKVIIPSDCFEFHLYTS
jgi:hypothetical protein